MTTPKTQLPPRLPFLQNRIAQVAILVEDLDKIVENYWAMFGIGPWHFHTYARPLVREMSYRGKTADYEMRIALSYIGPLRIELIESKAGDSIYADFIREHGYGVHHFGVVVEEMSDELAKANAAGLQMIQDGSGFSFDGDGPYAYLDTEELLGVTL